MQRSVLNFHSNISVWSAERETDKDREAQSEAETQLQTGESDKKAKEGKKRES